MVLLETGNWKLTTPSDSLLHTACVNHRPWRARWICPPSLSRAPADFVVGKNYRLQDIQLSKIFRGNYRPSELTVARGAFPRTPFAHSLAGPQSPAPFVRVFAWNVGSVAARPTFQSYDPARLAFKCGRMKLDSTGPPSRYALRWTTFADSPRWLANRSSLRSARCQAERLESEGWRIPGSNR